MTKASAPGRVELLGNHTDYNQGFVLAMPLGMKTTIEGESREDGEIIIESELFGEKFQTNISKIKPIPDKHWANYSIGVVAELLNRKIKLSGFSAKIFSDIPIGAGLASSSALEVSTALFLNKLFPFQLDKIELARVAQAAEHNFAGVKCGLLDQISSLFGKAGSAVFIDFKNLKAKNISLPKGYDFVIVNSGVKHKLVAGEYNERRKSCEEAAKLLDVSSLREIDMNDLEKNREKLSDIAFRRAKHVVGENERVKRAVKFISEENMLGLGKLMFLSHQSSIENFENSCKELNFLVERAKKFSDCLGARLSGGGFGGATINLLKSKKTDKFCDTIKKEYQKEFGREASIYPV